ncbi:MAG: AMP-binding protein [Myxococcales bacterium]|nr:AMP-binding protein [Myxococcales bacterium]
MPSMAPEPPLTLPGRLAWHAARAPDRTALRVKRLGIWQPYTWAEYLQETAACAAALAAEGIGPGDHVAIQSDNRPEWLFADLATQSLGARAVGIYQTNPEDDVAYILAHCGARALFCEDQEQVDKAIAIADRTPTVRRVIVFDPRGTRGYDDPRLVTYDDFRARGLALHAQDPHAWHHRVAALDPDAPTMVVYTSGTTGDPKGALLTGRNALGIAPAVCQFLGVTRDDALLSYLPLCHVAEKIFTFFTPLTAGCVVHFGESIETVREDLAEVSPTVFLGVPRIWEKMHAAVVLRMKDSSPLKRTLYHRALAAGHAIARRRREGTAGVIDAIRWWLADFLVYRPLQERLGLRRCRIPITGAAPIAPEIIEWFHAIGVRILEGYGQTECAGVSHCNPPGRARIGTVGLTLPGLECRTADDGEVLVRGPAVFAGYLHAPDATAATLRDGWLHTGDIGLIDPDGYLSITGRKKEIIITAGGKNLSPEKIENALKTSPYIKEAVAIGDRRKFVGALIQIEPAAVGDYATRNAIAYTSFADLTARPEVVALIERELRARNERLARVEQVRVFRLFDKELHQDDGELTATQKVRRRAITEKYAALIEDMFRGGAAPAPERQDG